MASTADDGMVVFTQTGDTSSFPVSVRTDRGSKLGGNFSRGPEHSPQLNVDDNPHADAEPVLSNTASTAVTDSQTNQKRIIYRIHCTDTTKHPPVDIFRYSWKPFENVASEVSDPNRQSLAPLDFSIAVDGFPLRMRKNQLRNTFGTSEDLDPGEFEIGVDFVSRGYSPMSMRIFSTHLRELLQNIVLYYPGTSFEDKEVQIQNPYKVLFHYWDQLQRVLREGQAGLHVVTIKNSETGSESEIQCNPTLLDHLDALLTAPDVLQVYNLTILPEKELHSKGLATYDNLWQLFRPGSTVFGRVRGKLSGFIILHAEKHRPHQGGVYAVYTGPSRWRVKVWNLAHNDGKLTRQQSRFYIDEFQGEKEISELPIFPIEFMNDDGMLKDNLIDRGKQYYKIICEDPSHMRYKGLAMAGNNDHNSLPNSSNDKDFGDASYVSDMS